MRFLLFVQMLAVSACVANTGSDSGSKGVELVDEAGSAIVFEESFESGEVEDRSARVVILEGFVERQNIYRAEVKKVLDAPVFVDVDTDFEGDKFWISRVSVRDANDQILWRDQVNTMFQLVEFLAQVIEQQSSLSLGIFQVYGFVYNQYPPLMEFALRMPIGIPGGVDFVLEVPEQTGEKMAEVFRAPIAELLAQAVPPSIATEVDTLHESGPAEDRLDVVIVGDGYREQDREAFELDTKAISRRLLETEPFKSHAGLINIHTAYTPSVERGAGYDCTGSAFLDAGCKRDFRDTAFGTTFVITALADTLNLNLGASDRVAMPLEIARIYEVAAQAQYDEIVLLSNSRRPSGFAGLYVAVLTTYGGDRNIFADVAVHELGHSFGVLGDEYQVEGDPCLLAEPRVPLPANIAQYSPDDFKWERWFEPGTPVPTPPIRRNDFPVGAYEGAYNCDALYRPAYDCKMNSSEKEDFCPICTEQMTRRFYSAVDVHSNRPARVVREGTSLRFESRMHHDDTIWKTTWLLDGQEVGQGASWLVGPDDITGEGTLEAVITEQTGNLRVDDPRTRSSVSWRVRSR